MLNHSGRYGSFAAMDTVISDSFAERPQRTQSLRLYGLNRMCWQMVPTWWFSEYKRNSDLVKTKWGRGLGLTLAMPWLNIRGPSLYWTAEVW